MNSFQKLEYIYQHFQDNEKIYESDPDPVGYETDNTLYPHINNDIKYGLFEDVINSYYLDSQIKDDFICDRECYTDTQEIQQDQLLTPCTHAYDHITQHINNLEDPMQQNTLYTMCKVVLPVSPVVHNALRGVGERSEIVHEFFVRVLHSTGVLHISHTNVKVALGS